MTALIKYDAACHALAEAKAVDEVLDIRDKAEALRAYGRIANNRKMEIDAAEIRLRAERKIGQMMAEEREAGRLNLGGPERVRSADNCALNTNETNRMPPLRQLGINENLAARARRLSEPNDREFERSVRDWRSELEQSHDRVTLNMLRENREPRERTTPTLNMDNIANRASDWLDNNYDPESQFGKYLSAIRLHHDDMNAGPKRNLVNKLNKIIRQLQSTVDKLTGD